MKTEDGWPVRSSIALADITFQLTYALGDRQAAKRIHLLIKIPIHGNQSKDGTRGLVVGVVTKHGTLKVMDRN